MSGDPASGAATPSEPDGAPRIASLDVLRGIAILGILFMNINEMGGSVWASWTDIRHFGWTPADRAAWWLREVFAEGTARCMLELLFGAGMVILTDRIARTVGATMVLRRYALRNLVLLGFGAIHLFVLLWPGDILHTYALAALAAMIFRERSAPALLALGLVMTLVDVSGGIASYRMVAQQQSAASIAAAHRAQRGMPSAADRTALVQATQIRAEAARTARRDAARVDAEDRARSRDARGWIGSAWATIVALLAESELSSIWEALSTMLIGAALFKWGIVQGRRSRPFYAAATVAGYAVGLSLRIVTAADVMRFDAAPSIGWATYEVARLAVTLGHLGTIQLLLGTAIGRRLLHPFIAAGRTALSLYIAQTLLCLWVIYPPFGLAWYGRQGWAAMMATALAIDLMLLVAANIWVRHFRAAPVEWAWRSILVQRRLPFRLRAADRA